VTSATRGRVLKAGDEIVFMMLSKEQDHDVLREQFNRERFEVQVRACYCSVLDDCWTFDSTRADPEPVASCPPLPAGDEWRG
jgi:hypothetical protein